MQPHPTATTICELESRSSDGIHVQLLWHRDDGRVTVFVADGHTGESFSVEVRRSESALDVFHHPFAYAAWRGIRTSSAETARAIVTAHE